MSTEIDNSDAVRIQRGEALQSLAGEIRERHEANKDRVERLRAATVSLWSEAVEISKLAMSAYEITKGGIRFGQWWTEQGLPAGWAAKYLRINRTASRRVLADKDQLRLIGVMDEAETHNDGQKPRQENPWAWTRYVGKINGYLRLNEVSRMSPTEAKLALKSLEPLEAIAKVLKERAGVQ